MKLSFLNNPGFKKGMGVASIVCSCIVTAVEAVNNQKKEKEFRDLQKAVEELQKANK